MYKGVPAYDEKLNHYIAFFKDKENAAMVKLGRDFHSIIERINKTKKVNAFNLAPLKNFAKQHGENPYGKAAQTALSKLSEDSNIKLPVHSYFLD